MSNEQDQITVNRAKYDEITLYEISEEELDTIERGSPSSNYLSFSLVLLSTFASFLASLLLADVQGKTYTFFVVITVVSGIVGTILLILWRQSNKSSKKIFIKIRSRKNVEKIREITVQDKIPVGEDNEQETI